MKHFIYPVLLLHLFLRQRLLSGQSSSSLQNIVVQLKMINSDYKISSPIRYSHVFPESEDAALAALAVVVAATLSPRPDGIVQDHKLGVTLVVDVDHLRLCRGRSAGGGDHSGGIIGVVTKQNLEC